MSDLERLAGAVLCAGFKGDTPRNAELEQLAKLRPGGLVLFSRNVTTREATVAVLAAAREAAGTDPYVGVDQEGGRVARLRAEAIDLPSMMAAGAIDDETAAQMAGAVLARDLERFDCDLDFAPVADLASDGRSRVIGTRSFGDDPTRAGKLAAAVVRGLQNGGAGATLKHFPGHGATAADSHEALPFVDAPAALLHGREFVAFAQAMQADPVAIMTAHVVARALDADRPATLSPKVVRDVLRGELKFRGVCFSDCLEMAAIARGVGTVRGALMALRAGCDVLLLSHTLSTALEVRDAIVRAVEDGSLARERLEEAAARVGAMRERLRALRAAATALGESDARAIALEIARRAVTLVRGELLLAEDAPVTVVSFEANTEDGIAGLRTQFASFSLALRTRGLRSELMRVSLEPDPGDVALMIETLLLQANRRLVVIARGARHFPAQRAAIDALIARFPGVLLVIAAEPFDIEMFPQAANVVCTYGDSATAFEGLADCVTGRARAEGRLPVTLSRAHALAAGT